MSRTSFAQAKCGYVDLHAGVSDFCLGKMGVCRLKAVMGYRESRRCSRDTYPESYITRYTSIRR